MDRHLKQTAFFGTERRPRPLERHYKAPGTQAPLPDIACRVVVGWGSNPTTDALESVPARPVTFVHQAAARTAATGIARVHKHDGYANQHRLVDDQAAQFVKPPVRHPRPLVPFDLDPVPNAMEVFQDDQRLAAFGICDNGFTQDVVGMALEPRLSAGSAPERTLGGAGADLLQGTASGVLTAADIINLTTRIGFAAVINGKIDDPHVDAHGIHCAHKRGFVGIACCGEHPLSPHEHQINLALGSLQQFPLPVAASEFDALPTSQRPDRDGILTWQETEYPLIKRLSGMSDEGATGLLVADLHAVSNLADAAHSSLGGQTKLGSQLGIGEPVQVKLAPLTSLEGQTGQPVACSVAPLQGIAQQGGLIQCWQQTDRGDELHRSDATLGFYKVILERKHRSGVGCVSLGGGHPAPYVCDGYLVKTCATPLSAAEPDSFSRSPL